jgi:hypothetical protein
VDYVIIACKSYRLLVQKLGGRYVYLPNAKAEQIVKVALS